MEQLKINHIAVWVNIVFLHILGSLWYGPLLGEPWMKMVGITLEEANAGMSNTGLWITNFISTTIIMYVMAWLFTKLNVDNLIKGLMMGLLIAFTFNFMPSMSGNMFAQFPYGLAWVTGGFTMAGWSIAGLIFGVWRKYV